MGFTRKVHTAEVSRPTRAEAAKLLADTAHAVKVMKASWLHVALNLKKIREFELWRYAAPPCGSYEEYAFEVLKLNRYVAARMLSAMEYTRQHRPQLIEDVTGGKRDVDIPSYEVVNQLRRVESAFQGHESELGELQSRVFEDGVGRVVLKREIGDRLASIQPETSAANDEPDPRTGGLGDVLRDLLAIEARLLELKAPGEIRRLAFQLIEALQREERRRGSGEGETGASPDEGANADHE